MMETTNDRLEYIGRRRLEFEALTKTGYINSDEAVGNAKSTSHPEYGKKERNSVNKRTRISNNDQPTTWQVPSHDRLEYLGD
jgi:hypothetical protein